MAWSDAVPPDSETVIALAMLLQLPVRKCVRLRQDVDTITTAWRQSSGRTADPASPTTGLDVSDGAAIIGIVVLAVTIIYLDMAVTGRHALLCLVGAGAGVILYQSAFGFTSAWRSLISAGRGDGLRAQLLMLSVTCAVFFPLIARGELLGQTLRGSVSPAGVGVVVGAFLFGVGMQLGGGCASGTLYAVGGGHTRMLVTLASFIVGSVIGTAHLPWWTARPSLPPLSLIVLWGPWAALASSVAVFGALALLTLIVERRSARAVTERALPERRHIHWLRGPWPLAAGAIGLALVNIATLIVGGRPWGITSAFALWGAKALLALHVSVDSWPYWSAPAQHAALYAPISSDVTSVMDAGLVLGAMIAAGLAGRFAPTWRISARSASTAVIGGLLLGYGARIAYGCNIGAYFSGIASGSLHGWVWLASAFTGSIVGTKVLVGLEISRPSSTR